MTARSRFAALAPALCVLAFSVVFLIWARRYDDEGRLVPVLVGWTLIALALLDVIVATGTRLGVHINEFFTGRIVGEAKAESGAHSSRRAFVSILWVVGFVAAVMVVGFFPVIPFYVFLFVVFQGRKRLSVGIWSSIATTLFAYVVFEWLLRYEVYHGILFEW